MSKPTAFTFTNISLPKSGVAVVLAGEGPVLAPSAQTLDERSGGTLTRAIEISAFKGKRKTALDLLVPAGLGLARLLVVGTGKLEDYTDDDWRALGGLIRAKLTGRESPQATIVVEAPGDAKAGVRGEAVAELAYGALLRGYKFDKYKTKRPGTEHEGDEKENSLNKITVQSRTFEAARKAFFTRRAVADGVLLARDLTNEPANVLGPKEFADQAKLLKKLDVLVDVMDERRLRVLGMNALLSVGQGSARPSLLAVMRWNGASKRNAAPVVVVGKGVCFDTGGISIKPAQGMEDMKGDMAGAACVTGLMHALAARKASLNAVGIIGLVENMVSGTAQRPGDVVTSMSGQTIEVINTDAEGRLVLADALWYAQKKYKPAALINLATLTGAIIVALGKEYAGLFSNNDQLADRLAAAGRTTGEKLWRLPLDPKFNKAIDSDVADMKNIGGRLAGSITAAQFLQRFVKTDVPWAHLDIAGTSMAAPKTDINQSWAPGYGVLLLDRLIADHYEN